MIVMKENNNLINTILFQGKSRATGKWVEGDFVRDWNGMGAAIKVGEAFSLVVLETVRPFTHLYDKNQNKIFYGDIVKNKYGFIQVVVFEFGAWHFVECIDYAYGERQGENFFAPDKEFVDTEKQIICDEIIGNMFDNPEFINPDTVLETIQKVRTA